MLRSLLVVVALLSQVPIHAQDRARPERNPVAHDEIWRFQAGAEELARARAIAASDVASADAITANLAIGSKSGALNAARKLLTASPDELAKGLRLILENSHEFSDDGTLINRELVAFVADARRRVDSLLPSDGADAALPLLWLEETVDRGDDSARNARIAAFLERHKGTTAAFTLMLGQIERDNPRDDEGRLQRYRELAREHDGTEAGAVVLRHLGFRRAADSETGVDPTSRLLEVFAIIKRLESGRFPPSHHVDSAGEMVVDFYFGINPRIATENFSRLYAAYLEFVLSHPNVTMRASGDPIAWIIENGVSRLCHKPVECVAVVDRFLVDLEKGGFDVNEVRFQRAQFYLGLTEDPGNVSDHLEGGIAVAEADARAREALRQVISSGESNAVARAHATLAGNYLAGGRYPDAVNSYTALLTQFPDKEWAWVPAFRIAQLAEVQGLPDAAAKYAAVAARFAKVSFAVLLAHISAGYIHEGRANYPAATASYRAAMTAWSDLPGQLGEYGDGDTSVAAQGVFRRFAYLKRADLAARLERLAATTTIDTALLHQGRYAIESEKPRDAIAPLNRLLKDFPRSSAAVEGREMLRRARFEIALDPFAAGSERELESLTRGPYDRVTTLAKLAIGAIRIRTGAIARGESITKAALEEWHKHQAPIAVPVTPLEQDIVAIRAELFLPKGGGIFGTDGGNAFDWPAKLSPFLVVSRDIHVKSADGSQRKVAAPFQARTGRVLFASSEELAAMERILDRIGGTETREPTAIMETPHQPIGTAVTIAQSWSKFFPLQPWHWGGWVLTAYPSLSTITFDREGHALAEVTIGYGGSTIELVKENGKWIAKREVSIWVT